MTRSNRNPTFSQPFGTSSTMNTTHRSLALFIILTVILLVLPQDATSSLVRRKRFTCPEELAAPNCSCEVFSSKTNLYCPAFNPVLYVDVEDGMRVDVKCHDEKLYDFRSLKNLEIGNASLLTVEYCTLDAERPILGTFEFLGVRNVRNLMYKSDDAVRYNVRYFEGLEQLENLTLVGGVAGIDRGAFSEFRNLKRLTIMKNRLDLQPEVFETLTNLTYLGLYENHINALPPGLFDGLENLESLSLSYNDVKSIAAGSFNGLNSLRMLNLRVNKIESFDEGAFDALQNLSRLEMTLNPFVKLPSGLFSATRKLKTLILTHNLKLAALPEEMLANLKELTVVKLSNNIVRKVPGSLFSRSSGIVELNLGYNRLDSLPEELLSDQHELQVLNLEHNQLESIPEYLLERNFELQTLYLSDNRLKSLPEKAFSKLKNLKELHLKNNQLQTIPQFLFSGTPKLEELYMQNNQLALHANSFIHDELSIAENDNTPFQELQKLRILNLRNNSISTIYQDWYINNLELQSLDLSFNKLPGLSYVQLQFQSNISLNLSNNEISQVILIDDLDMKPYQRINVDLNSNPLDCTCNVLKFVQLVQSKSEHGLRFTVDNLRCAAPPNLVEIPVDHLQTKDLLCDLEPADACPKECQCAMRLLDHTVIVNCSARGLTKLPDLPVPSQLHEDFNALELHVENNRLTELPNLAGYSELTQLYARNNSIRELLPNNIPSNLRIIDLSQNHLQMIDDLTLRALNHSRHLETINLSQNQWLCDCPASSFLLFVQQNSRLISDLSAVQCHSSGKSLDSITVNDLCFEDYTTKIVICFAIAIFGLLIGLISLLFFRYQTEVKVWLFTHNLFLSLITEEELDRDKLYDAFISYSHLDEEFITDELIPKLENEPMNFKTCWHVRDFMPGEMIMSQIVKSIESSRRTVIVLSKNFLESSWAKQEFRQAHVQSMEDNRVRVIVVIYEDIGDIECLDGELKAYLKTNTYVKWGDPWFWQKLRYAMPHPLKVKGIQSAVSEIHLQQVTTTKETPTAV